MNDKCSRRTALKAAASMAIGASLMGTDERSAEAADAGKPKRFYKAVVWNMIKAKNDLERFRICKEGGLDGVEGGPLGSEAQRKAQKAAADEAGIKIHSIMFGGWGTSFGSPDEKVIARNLKGMEDSLLTAKAVGADAVLLVPAVCRGGITQEQAWERSQKNVRKLFPLCKDTGVVMAIENVWNNFTYKLEDFVRYIDEFESPYVKAYFDVGNHVIRSHIDKPQDWIRTLGKRTVKIHAKDYKLTGKGRGHWADLMEGSVEWPEVMKALNEVGYKGWFTCEVGGGGLDRMKDLSKRLDKIFSSA